MTQVGKTILLSHGETGDYRKSFLVFDGPDEIVVLKERIRAVRA